MSGFQSEVSSITLKNSTNQIQLGNPDFLAATTILSCATPSASRTISIPDAGANSNILLSQGSQTVAVTQTFSSAPVLTASSNQISAQPGGSSTSTVLNF